MSGDVRDLKKAALGVKDVDAARQSLGDWIAETQRLILEQSVLSLVSPARRPAP